MQSAIYPFNLKSSTIPFYDNLKYNIVHESWQCFFFYWLARETPSAWRLLSNTERPILWFVEFLQLHACTRLINGTESQTNVILMFLLLLTKFGVSICKIKLRKIMFIDCVNYIRNFLFPTYSFFLNSLHNMQMGWVV